MTFIDELKATITFLLHASVEEIVIVILFILVCCSALLFEFLWLRGYNRYRSHSPLENNESTAIAEPMASAPLIMNIKATRRGLVGKLAWKAFSIASRIRPSTHRTRRPVPIDTIHAIKPLISSGEYKSNDRISQSQQNIIQGCQSKKRRTDKAIE